MISGADSSSAIPWRHIAYMNGYVSKTGLSEWMYVNVTVTALSKIYMDTTLHVFRTDIGYVAVARFSEPLALTSVFPYLPEMIESFGVDKKNVARWAGVTSGVFSVCQSAIAIPWGRAADRAGRKPIILLGLLNAMITFVIWGMTTSLPMAIVVRGLQGAGSGNGMSKQKKKK